MRRPRREHALSKINERVERAEKRRPKRRRKTARLLQRPKSRSANSAPRPAHVTGSIVEKQQARLPIVEGGRSAYLRRREMVQSTATASSSRPRRAAARRGRVESVRRQDGRWSLSPQGLDRFRALIKKRANKQL